MQRSTQSLIRILIVQTQVVFNDNAVKLMLIGLAQMVLPKDDASIVVHVLASLFVAAFILFSPICGWLSDHFSKRNVMWWDLILQLAIGGLLVYTIKMEWLYFAVFCLFLLSIQATIFSPAKQGILKEVVGSLGLPIAVGWMEMLTICAALVGGYFGGGIFDKMTKQTHDAWEGAFLASLFLLASCIFSILIFYKTPSEPALSRDTFRWNLLWKHFYDLKDLWSHVEQKWAAIGIAYFYAVGSMFYLILVQIGSDAFGDKVGAVTRSGFLLMMLGAGIAMGSLTAATICRKKMDLLITLIGGWGMVIGTVTASFFIPYNLVFSSMLLFTGFFCGLFIVPLCAYLQDMASEERRGRILAATNLIMNIGAIVAIGLQYLMAEALDWSTQTQLLCTAGATLAITIYGHVLLEKVFRTHPYR
jgi:acyl-[acyl-carrier-protein]-phospholipid O-acyltransferase/long-chain-fatty-acid--[acyl-carrier-protein] ligase